MDILQSIGILDIIFIVLLTISILLGLIRGVIREVLSLAGLIASVYLAFTFSDMIANKYVSKFLEDPSISYIVTFVLIIIATLFAVTLVNLFFSQLLKASGLSVLNRILGAIFGVLRGALICSILVMVISFIPGVTAQNWWKNSSLVPVFSQLSKSAVKHMPDEMSNYFSQAKDKVGSVANEVAIPLSSQSATTTTNTTTNNNNNNNSVSDKQIQAIQQSIAEPVNDSNNTSKKTQTQNLPIAIELESIGQ